MPHAENQLPIRDLVTSLFFIFVCFLQLNQSFAQASVSAYSLPGFSRLPATPTTRRKVANFPQNPQPDIILGGLFPVHSKTEAGVRPNCGSINVQRGLHRLEAMLFAVDQINKENTLLPNVTLGVSAHDTCGLETVALEESLEFIMELIRKENSVNCQSSLLGDEKLTKKPKIFAGVVGAAASVVSIQVANLLRLFKLPQISYASTTPSLSDKVKYDYFVRTVPPDNYQARAMMDIVRAMNWSSVFTVNSQGIYGQGGMEEFISHAKDANICVVSKFQFDSDTDSERLDKLIAEFEEQPNTRGVVLFCNDLDIRMLLSAAKRKAKLGRFVWIASDYWGSQSKPVDGLEDVAEGAITVSLKRAKHEEFVNYYNALRPGNHSKVNPWFDYYWQLKFNCSLNPNRTTCPANASFAESNRSIDDKVPFVIDAVYAFAHALHALYVKTCPALDGVCDNMKNLDGKELLSFLHNVTFKGVTGNVSFNRNGNTQGR